jgi:hypothetical protein
MNYPGSRCHFLQIQHHGNAVTRGTVAGAVGVPAGSCTGLAVGTAAAGGHPVVDGTELADDIGVVAGDIDVVPGGAALGYSCCFLAVLVPAALWTVDYCL